MLTCNTALRIRNDALAAQTKCADDMKVPHEQTKCVSQAQQRGKSNYMSVGV
jgi:hypothetical protein